MTRRAREIKFLEEYLLDGNATRAAKDAGYSARTAHVQGHKLVRKYKAEIDARLAAQKSELRKTIGVTKERIIRELACIGFMDARDFFDGHGNPIEIPELKARARRAIAGFDFTEDYLNVKDPDGGSSRTAAGYTKKYKLSDKTKALDLIAKLLGFYPRENDKGLKDSMTLEELVLGSMQLEEDEVKG